MELNKLLKRKQRALDDGNKASIAEICNKIGTFYYHQNKLEKALVEFKEEANLYEELDMRIDYGRANRMLTEIYIIQENFDAALKHEDVYMKSAKDENDLIELQRAYITLGRIYLLKGQDPTNRSTNDLKSAEKAFLKSLIISKEVSKDMSKFQLADMQSRIYLNLGLTKEEMKSFDEAIDCYKTALKLCKSNDLFELQHKCLMCIALCYTLKYDDTSSAMQNFNNALEIAKRIDGKSEKICETLLAKSDLLIKNGDFQSAKKLLKKAFKLKTSVDADMDQIYKNLKIVHALCRFEDELITTDSFDYENRKRLFEKLGDGSCKLKNYKKGIDSYLKQLEAAELNGDAGKQLILIYVSLYQTYSDMGDYDNAMKFMQHEYELIKDEPKDACVTLMSMANLLHLAKRDFWEVDSKYRKALSEARLAGDKAVEGSIVTKLVSLCNENHMTSLAEILENEAKNSGINLNGESEEIEMSEDLLDSNDLEADDFELSTDSDLSDNENKAAPKANVRKKRSIAVKKNAKGETKLHEASISGNYQLAKMLLDQGHPVNIRDNAGWMCIHEASNHGHRDIVELLLDNGAQSMINDKGGVNCDGITPIYDACSNGHLSVVQLLIDRGAKTTIKTDSNQTPLDALLIWHENSRESLTSTEMEFYEDIKQRLVKQCEKVGMDTTKIQSISLASSGYASLKSNSRFDNDLSDENEVEEINDKKSSHDVDENYIKKNARHEYKSVMEKLKNPHADAKYGSGLDSAEPKKRSAYLTEKELDVDEWLDDDLRPSRKKQKKSLQNESILPRKCSIGSDLDENFGGSLSDSGVNSIDAFDVLMSTNGEGNDNFKSRRNSNSKLQRKMSNQSSLLDAGFSKFAEIDETTRRLSPSKAVSTLSTNVGSNDSQTRGSLTAEKPTIIKVQIDGEKIIVPINRDAANELKISWLIDESARRYYCLKGIRPEMKLKTADGATLMDTDPLNLILCLTEEHLIFSEILDWKLPSLSDRYLEACSEYKCAIDRDMNEILDLNRTSVNIDLSNQNLRASIIRPILKAFHHQYCLTHIDLSNNFIQDEGLKYLTQAIVTLKNLSFIDLSGNGITENGIEYFCTALSKSALPNEIKELKLNFNPIKSNSLRFISDVCRNKLITSLSLVSCKLTDVDNEMEQLCYIKELNISYNHFTLSGLRNFLRKLNSTCMEALNIERCTKELNVGEIIVNFLSSGPLIGSLKDINLSGLKLSENEILDILRCLQAGEKLMSLDLSYQNDLTFLSLKFILFNINNGNLSVNLVGCRGLQKPFDIKCSNQLAITSHPCHIQLSLQKIISDEERCDYLIKVRDLWSMLTDSRGTLHDDRNVLHLLGENQNV